jgi:hypothetical protein
MRYLLLLTLIAALPLSASAQTGSSFPDQSRTNSDSGSYYRRYSDPVPARPQAGLKDDSFAVGNQRPTASSETRQSKESQYGNEHYPVQQQTSSSAPVPLNRTSGEIAAVESDSYDPVQLLDGWGAMFVALGEPIVFRPAVRVKDCLNSSQGGTRIAAAPFCGLYGVAEGLVFTIIDAGAGLCDIATGGYFKLSRKAGVFVYFK